MKLSAIPRRDSGAIVIRLVARHIANPSQVIRLTDLVVATGARRTGGGRISDGSWALAGEALPGVHAQAWARQSLGVGGAALDTTCRRSDGHCAAQNANIVRAALIRAW